MIQGASRTFEFSEAFFFGAEFPGVRDEAATGASRGMFNVQHFVEEDVLDGELRDIGAVHAAIEKNLIRAGIVAAELASPGTQTPADVRTLKLAFEIFSV